jgi:hypothetical protein
MTSQALGGGGEFALRLVSHQRVAPLYWRSDTHKHTHIRLLGGLLPIHLWHWRGAQGVMWGARGPCPPAAAMAVAVVTPFMFCAKATEKCNKNTKISCC